jgi:hypothetical protein
LVFYCNANGAAPLVVYPLLIGPEAMSTVDDLRAKAIHYREMEKHITDPRSLEVIQDLASELDRQADALEKEGRSGGSPVSD